MTQPHLTTRRLILRAPEKADIDAYHDLLSQPEVTRYTDIPDQPTRKRVERLVSWMSKLDQRDNGCGWIIEKNTTGDLIGAIRINEIQRRSRLGVIGYELHPDWWSRGLMSEAVGAVLKICFNHYELNRVEAWTLPGNPASDHVLRKNGFTHEGTLRARNLIKGELRDCRMFSILADEYPRRKI